MKKFYEWPTVFYRERLGRANWYGYIETYKYIKDGNYGWALPDVIGVIVDVCAMAVHIIPGGASTGLKIMKYADKTVDLTTNYTKSKKINETFGRIKVKLKIF